jgi:hypothetical protein
MLPLTENPFGPSLQVDLEPKLSNSRAQRSLCVSNYHAYVCQTATGTSCITGMMRMEQSRRFKPVTPASDLQILRDLTRYTVAMNHQTLDSVPLDHPCPACTYRQGAPKLRMNSEL